MTGTKQNRRISCLPQEECDAVDDCEQHSFRFFAAEHVNAETFPVPANPTELRDSKQWPPYNKQLSFDWSVPTHIAYHSPAPSSIATASISSSSRSQYENEDGDTSPLSSPFLFTPPFQAARSKLDYSYHKRPALPRQIFQDGILERILASANKREEGESSRNWIIFTAGPMAAGKSYVLSQLYQRDLLPLDNFVKIDPDLLKNELPEMVGYEQYLQREDNKDGTSAGTMVHRESTQLSDVLFEHSLLEGRSFLVDGSLRDIDWNTQLFTRLRNDYQNYHLVILYVSSDPTVIQKRARERAASSGREVPQDTLQASIEQVPASVQALKQYTDLTVEIVNNDDEPLDLNILHTSELIKAHSNRQDTWEWFGRLWKSEDELAAMLPMLSRNYTIYCRMSQAFGNPTEHQAASQIWLLAYPNFCFRCSVACDGQCGLCLHGRHRCICTHCQKFRHVPSGRRESLLE